MRATADQTLHNRRALSPSNASLSAPSNRGTTRVRTPRPRTQPIVLLIDIGNTHTHLGLAQGRRILRTCDLRTADWQSQTNQESLLQWLGKDTHPHHACLCSVVPAATPSVQATLSQLFSFHALQLSPATVRGIGIDYPRPETIGQDRLANAIAVQHHFGAPSVVVDFGTAVTFDVVNRRSEYTGGIIAPGLAAMTEYLHEKTALLPRIVIREPRGVIGRNTYDAMLIGAVHGYRGLVRELIRELRTELKVKSLPVVATGGYAALIARKLPEITAVRPSLTLEGLRLTWAAHHAKK
jgi:type III pantothenate kinase